MDTRQIKEALLTLSVEERKALLQEIEEASDLHVSLLENRRQKLNDKIGSCPHCSSKKYRKHGTAKGSQRYYCNSCKRSFTEYTGTWLSGIHKKELLSEYLRLMEQELSLDKFKRKMGINKKTAFDWRHKILSSMASTFWLLSKFGYASTNSSNRNL